MSTCVPMWDPSCEPNENIISTYLMSRIPGCEKDEVMVGHLSFYCTADMMTPITNSLLLTFSFLLAIKGAL